MATVILSGGELGGRTAKDWPVGEQRIFKGSGDVYYEYRRDAGEQAIFTGEKRRGKLLS